MQYQKNTEKTPLAGKPQTHRRQSSLMGTLGRVMVQPLSQRFGLRFPPHLRISTLLTPHQWQDTLASHLLALAKWPSTLPVGESWRGRKEETLLPVRSVSLPTWQHPGVAWTLSRDSGQGCSAGHCPTFYIFGPGPVVFIHLPLPPASVATSSQLAHPPPPL